MKRGKFTKEYTVSKILDYYNVSKSEAESIYNKTYEKIRYATRKENLKGFHSRRETFFSIFSSESSTFRTDIDPTRENGLLFSIWRSTSENTLVESVGKRLETLRGKYEEVENIYQNFLKTKDLTELNKQIKDFKKNSVDYLKGGS